MVDRAGTRLAAVANLRRFGPLVVGAALLVAYLTRVDYHELAGRAGAFTWQAAVAVLFLNLANGLLKVARWRILTGPVHVGLAKRYLAVNAAFFWGLVTPGTSGELTRGLLLGDASGRLLGTLLLEKVTDLGVLCLCVVLAAIAYLESSWVAAILALPIIALGLGATMVALRYDRIFTAVPKTILGILLTPSRLRDSKEVYWQFHGLATNTPVLLSSAAFSGLLWILPLVQMLILYRGLGAEVPIRTAAIGFFLPYLAGVLSMVPLGIGVFDLGLGRLSVFLGSAAGQVSAAPIFFRVLVTLPLIVFGYGCHLILTLRPPHHSVATPPA